MAQDSIISAVLETYAEDATDYNDNMNIVWAESTDPEIASYITFLLDSLKVDKNIFTWAYSLIKYGDIYLRLYRESAYQDSLFKKTKRKRDLQEAIKLNAYPKSDKYVHYAELVKNPANIFSLSKFGKTVGYIQTHTPLSAAIVQGDTYNSAYFKYDTYKSDIDIFQPTEFVHGSLVDNSSRTQEEITIFKSEEDKEGVTYQVQRGQSILYNSFRTWRELMLLQNSVLLNRLTKSSIVRTVNVEVGDMPKENVGKHLIGIKNLIEQKAALNTDQSMNEYTNPGPYENNIYIPTRNGMGSISVGQIGGDVDVKSLADLDYFKNRLYGALKVPKQYFGDTDDAAGFNGGTSLSIISSRYAKTIKRIQNVLVQTITDAINLMLFDKGYTSYINKFTIHMQPPTTQEEIDRRDNLSSKVSIAQDIMNITDDIQDPAARLKILKALLSNVIEDSDVTEIIQEEIDKLEEETTAVETNPQDDEENIDNMNINIDASPSSFNPEDETTEIETEVTAEEEPEDINLPTPEELGQDFSQISDEE